ncbi:MAG: DinB family protein [Gemmatimonadales bacterium]
MFRLSHRLLGVVAAFALAAPAASARAQYAPDRATAVEVRKEFLTNLDSLQSKFLSLAEAIPADKYSWRPAPGVRSVGEVFMHVASEYYFWTPAIFGIKPSPVVGPAEASFDKFEKMSSKPEVLKHLKEGFAFGRGAISGMEDGQITGLHKSFGRDQQVIQMSIGMIDDLHEHLGQLIAYARMNGVKPPWSK